MSEENSSEAVNIAMVDMESKSTDNQNTKHALQSADDGEPSSPQNDDTERSSSLEPKTENTMSNKNQSDEETSKVESSDEEDESDEDESDSEKATDQAQNTNLLQESSENLNEEDSSDENEENETDKHFQGASDNTGNISSSNQQKDIEKNDDAGGATSSRFSKTYLKKHKVECTILGLVSLLILVVIIVLLATQLGSSAPTNEQSGVNQQTTATTSSYVSTTISNSFTQKTTSSNVATTKMDLINMTSPAVTTTPKYFSTSPYIPSENLTTDANISAQQPTEFKNYSNTELPNVSTKATVVSAQTVIRIDTTSSV
ncbi:uncharacterized protein LOC143469533 [Clavelina lepadiformis]|uniref:Uncharacterized protein n=1 Tax=Clavelina lepadiformis TaxID=159417 RepID=A0ABP0FZ99_CLALP